MKKVLIFAIFTLLLAGFALAEMERANYVELNETNEEELLGASCGTVTPGTQNECCINKGYDSWNEERWECVKEVEEEEDELRTICETAAPGTKAQCCVKKGYSSWSQVEEKCTGERRADYVEEQEDPNCEAWKCTEWSECNKWQKTRRCMKTSLNCTADKEAPITTRECWEKDELRLKNKTRECPEKCECSGSTVKCAFENGTRVMTIYAGDSGNVIVQVKDVNMSTNVVLYKNEEGKIYALINGEEKEIILPDKVKERIRERTKARFENESMNLNEDGYYKFEAEKKVKLLGIFKIKRHMEAQINAETGEVLQIKNPWWGFLAKDIEEEVESEEVVIIGENLSVEQ